MEGLGAEGLPTAALGKGNNHRQVWNPDQRYMNVMGCKLDSGMPSFALSSSWEDPRGWRRRPTRTHGGVLHFSFAVPDGKEHEYEMRVGQRISRSIPNGARKSRVTERVSRCYGALIIR